MSITMIAVSDNLSAPLSGSSTPRRLPERVAKRYGHTRPEEQRLALESIAAPEIQEGVRQNMNPMGSVLESELAN
jgi:hypothetical protein